MNKLIGLVMSIFICHTIQSQNVGIGTASPLAKLDVVNTSPPLMELTNSTPLNTNESTKLFFKNGSYYTGIIGTYGLTSNTARLGLSTYASQNSGSLFERLSILDNGSVGINTITPTSRLHIIEQGSNLMELTNSSTLSSGVATKMLFKAGSYYTGLIATYGTANNSARLGFSAFATASPNSLLERFSILDNGKVGINNIAPSAQLEVTGMTKLVQSTDNAALEIDGKIKVSGNKAAFLYTTTAANLYNGGKGIIIDNPLCNADPNALIFITAREIQVQGMGGYFVKYNAGLQKWIIQIEGYYIEYTFVQYRKICNDDCEGSVVDHSLPNQFNVGDKFNILIISN